MSGLLTYRYDGSFEGLLCCVFESYSCGELPDAILGPGEEQLSLFGQKEIVTDRARYERVFRSVLEKMGGDALDFIRRAFLTCLPAKERRILLFMRKGYRYGPMVMELVTDADVDVLAKAVRRLGGETHKLSGFLRFSVYGEVLAAQITPENFVLPLLAPHFAGRFPEEKFLIYDKTHESVLLCEPGDLQIKSVERFEMPQPDEEELKYRRLWKMFYDTIAVEGRYNPRCRMSLMPRRYWRNMTEFASGSLGEKRAIRADEVRWHNIPK
jgi:probable DNA metabolism protein